MGFVDPIHNVLGLSVVGLIGSLVAGSWIGAAAFGFLLIAVLVEGRGAKLCPFELAFGWLGRVLDAIKPEESVRRFHGRCAAGWGILACFAGAFALKALGAVWWGLRNAPLNGDAESVPRHNRFMLAWLAFSSTQARPNKIARRNTERGTAGAVTMGSRLPGALRCAGRQ